jgi:hypothetical protein
MLKGTIGFDFPGLSSQTDSGKTIASIVLEPGKMKQTLGLLMQLAALSMLPAIIIFQLFYGFRLIVMPISLLCGICVFSLGTWLRESGA